jgi:hypothetical protein
MICGDDDANGAFRYFLDEVSGLKLRLQPPSRWSFIPSGLTVQPDNQFLRNENASPRDEGRWTQSEPVEDA